MIQNNWSKREAAHIWYNRFLFLYEYSSTQVNAEVGSTKATCVRMRKKKPVISNKSTSFCFNSNVSKLYNNYAIIYFFKNVKNRENSFFYVNEFTLFSYYNICQILKLDDKTISKNIGLYERSLTAACNLY